MPRCQRTFQRLGVGAIQSDTGRRRWVCPYCPDAEVYESIHSPDLLEYLAQTQRACFADFGTPRDSARSILLIAGLYPECVQEPLDRRYDIYLQQGSDPFQLRLQIGHEVFHRICSQGRIFHWTHEMLACLVSVRLLRSYGATEYAAQMEHTYAAQAALLPLNVMLGVNLSLPPYPPGLYGRAFVTGQALEQAVGWPTLCRLARCLNRTGQPDFERWIADLPAATRLSVRDIFTPPNE